MQAGMKIVQITPGAGGMYCGNCFRDNALVASLRKLGHDAILLPLYLPMTLDEAEETHGTPLFFSGINVYLEQKIPLFKHAPNWMRNIFTSPKLLKIAGSYAGRTKADQVGDLTISMLHGEQGNQARELEELVEWLKKAENKPDIICLSNALLAGMGRRLQQDLQIPVACMLQGEDSFLNALGPRFSGEAWKILAERVSELSLILAPSRYYAERMAKPLSLPLSRIKVVYNGINLEGYSATAPNPDNPVIGYFARMCPEKGLDLLVEAFIGLKKRAGMDHVQLHVGGSCGPGDEAFVAGLKTRLKTAGVSDAVRFFPNVSREEKIRFFDGLTVFSVPAPYGEAFGLYIIEALAAGVPVVQPSIASFPELVHETGGGLLYSGNDPREYISALQRVISESELRFKLAAQGRRAVHEKFSAQTMARHMAELFSEALHTEQRRIEQPA